MTRLSRSLEDALKPEGEAWPLPIGGGAGDGRARLSAEDSHRAGTAAGEEAGAESGGRGCSDAADGSRDEPVGQPAVGARQGARGVWEVPGPYDLGRSERHRGVRVTGGDADGRQALVPTNDGPAGVDLREYFNLARKWLWLVVLSTAAAAVAAWLVTLGMPKQFASQTTLLVGRAAESVDPDWQTVYLSQNLAQTYATMVTRQPVLSGVMDDLELEGSWQELRGKVRAAPVPGASLIEIRVVDYDPNRAQAIADAAARRLQAQQVQPYGLEREDNREFVNEQIDTLRDSIIGATGEVEDLKSQIGLATSARAIADLEAQLRARETQIESWRTQLAALYTASQGGESSALSIIEPASPGTEVGPNSRMNILFAAALGFGLAIAAALVLEYLDDTVKTTEGIERRLGVTGLGTIERVANVQRRGDALVTVREPRSPVAEAYRVLRANLEFALVSHPTRSLLVTSASRGEGKSTTAANLAVALAMGGSRIVLVDTDLRRPSLHRIFGLANSVGLTSLLLDGSLAASDVMQQVADVPGLRLVTSGPLPPNPAELLKTVRTRKVLERLGAEADLVILDSPPLLVVVDGAILSTFAGATILVFECGVTRMEAARRALSVLGKVGVVPIGTVVNKLDRTRVGGYYYDYAYRYGEYYRRDAGDGSAPPTEGASGERTTGATVRSGRHRRRRAGSATQAWFERVRRTIAGMGR